MRLRILLGLTLLAGLWWFVVRPGDGAAAKSSPDSGPAGPKTVVVLSPGHGWWSTDSQQVDPGATGAGLAEKDVALDVAQQAQRLLDRCPVQARLTRAGDDKDHTLANVHELVNAEQPALGHFSRDRHLSAVQTRPYVISIDPSHHPCGYPSHSA